MNRAPTTVSVPPLRYQHGSGLKKRKYKRVTKRKTKHHKKRKSNVKGRGLGISSLIRTLLRA